MWPGHVPSLCLALDVVLKHSGREMFGFHFKPMEMFPLFVIQCIPKRDSGGLVCSQNQLTCVLSKHIRESGVFAWVTLTSALTVQLPKAALKGIRNGGNRCPSGLCVCVCERTN